MKALISPSMESAPTIIDGVHLRGTNWAGEATCRPHFMLQRSIFLLCVAVVLVIITSRPIRRP
jgi:hypothetical protein